MEIKYLLFFLVVCIYKNRCESRPTAGSNSFKIIRSLTDEMTITIKGTMKGNANILLLSLLDKNRNSVCSLTYNAGENTATVQSELSQEDTTPYFAEHNPEVETRFSLKINAKISDQKQLIQLHFEVDSAGPLFFEAHIHDFKSIHRIVVDGAHSVSSLLFTML